MRDELSNVTAKLDRLTQAVVLGGDLPTLVAEMKALERRRAYLEAEVQNVEHVEGLSATDLQALEPELLTRLEDWRAMFRRHVLEARQMIAKILTGRVVFTPRATGAEWAVEYAAECSLGKLVSGILVPKAVVAPTGFEPVFQGRRDGSPTGWEPLAESRRAGWQSGDHILRPEFGSLHSDHHRRAWRAVLCSFPSLPPARQSGIAGDLATPFRRHTFPPRLATLGPTRLAAPPPGLKEMLQRRLSISRP
jgi:hypothetical protein